MKFLLLHLSDLHSDSNDELSSHFDTIFTVTKNIADACDLVLLLVSGDISNKNKQTGYVDAFISLTKLVEDYNKLKLPRVEILIVPGNHDCNLEEQDPVRDRLLRDILTNDEGIKRIDDRTIDICTKPQESFFEFVHEFDAMKGAFQENRIIWKKVINIANDTINIYAINTAWMSTKTEAIGKLILPEELISDYMKPSNGISIALMHHPFNWFKPWNSKRLRDYFESCSNIICTGHEHYASSFVTSNEKSQITFYSDASSFQNTSYNKCYAYQINSINEGSYSITKYIINTREKPFLKIREDDKQISVIESKQNKGYLSISNAIKSFIKDIGANLRHPQRSSFTLEDIFVYPDLQYVNPNPLLKLSYEETVINSENAFVFNNDIGSKYIVLGQSRSGRTTLLKKIYSNLLHDGFMPIWINGARIKSTNDNDIQAMVNQEALVQYRDMTLTEINIFDNNKKVILIDDFDESTIHRRFRRKFMDILKRIYINILVTSHDLLEIEELTGNEPEASIIYDGFKLFQIKEFGNFRRSLLIKSWFSLNNDPYSDKNEYLRELDHATEVINKIIGKNLTPAHPIIILVLLQNITKIDPINFKQSSYGYYYQSLIMDSLRKTNPSPEAINAFNSFLSSLAFSMFTNDHKYLEDDTFSRFRIDYAERLDIQNKIDLIIDEVLQSRILINKEGRYLFAYKYMFYFFTAQYMSDKISNSEIKKTICKMASHPYNENYSNILMFLSYLSKDPVIIESLISAAILMFPNDAPIKLDDDILALNKLYLDIPKLVLKQISVEDARESASKVKDQIESVENYIPVDMDECIEIENELTLVDKISSSLKLAEIIGQVVKNSYASLEGVEKLKLVEQTYLLILKPLGLLLRLIMNEPENIAAEISKVMKAQPIYDLEDQKLVEEYAIAYLARICCIITYTFISRVSQFVGTENLAITFDKLMVTNQTTAYRLIDAVIKVDHFCEFPITSLRRLNKDLEHNPLAKIVLSQTVRKYLYMFEIKDYRYKQQICQEFGIEMREMYRIENISKDKKGER